MGLSRAPEVDGPINEHGDEHAQSDQPAIHCDEAIAEYNSSGVMLRRFVHGPGFDEPIVWYEGAGTSDRRWLVQNEQNSVIAVTNASGAALNINTYDEYGVPGSSNTGRFQYTGQMWIAEASIYHYKARAYAPMLGRFLQTDPILYAGGMNLYACVANDPINLVDPLGLDEDIVVTRDHSERQNVWDLWKVMGLNPPSPYVPGTNGEPRNKIDRSPRKAEKQQIDPCAGMASPFRTGAETFFVDLRLLQSVAQAKYFLHSWPLSPSGIPQSVFGGQIRSGEEVAAAAYELLATRIATPAGGLNVRITGDMGFTTGVNVRTNSETSYLTVILGPLIPDPLGGLPQRMPVSMFPGC